MELLSVGVYAMSESTASFIDAQGEMTLPGGAYPFANVASGQP